MEHIFPFSYSILMNKLFPDSFPISSDSASFLPSFSPVSPDTTSSTPVTTPSTISSPQSPISPSHSPVSPTSSHYTGSPIFSPFVAPEVLFSAPGQVLRKSLREHHAPKYLSDDICNSAFSIISPNPPCLPLHFFSFSALTPQNQGVISSICHISEPTSF